MKYHRGASEVSPKYIVSVSKTYNHRGNHRHKSKTKKRWFIYYYDEDGTIDALPKEKAEQLVKIIKERMEAVKKLSHPATVSQQISIADELSKLAKLKEQGVILDDEFLKMKQELIKKM